VASLSKAAAEATGERPDPHFLKLYEAEESVRRACQLAKAAEFSPFEPRVFGREAVNPDNPLAMLEAYQEILRTIRERWPFRSPAQQTRGGRRRNWPAAFTSGRSKLRKCVRPAVIAGACYEVRPRFLRRIPTRLMPR